MFKKILDSAIFNPFAGTAEDISEFCYPIKPIKVNEFMEPLEFAGQRVGQSK